MIILMMMILLGFFITKYLKQDWHHVGPINYDYDDDNNDDDDYDDDSNDDDDDDDDLFRRTKM